MKFTIRPRPKGGGFNLESEALSGPLWYGDTTSAVGYAQHRAGSAKGTIELLDRDGKVVATINLDPSESEQGSRLGKI